MSRTGSCAVDMRRADSPNGNWLFGCRVPARLRELAVGLFVVTISQAAESQRPDTTMRSGRGGGMVQVPTDTSSGVYGASRVPLSVGSSIGVIDSATIAVSAARTLSDLLAARVAGALGRELAVPFVPQIDSPSRISNVEMSERITRMIQA